MGGVPAAKRLNTPRMRPTPLYNLIGVLSRPVLYGLYRLRARGLENLPREGGYVLACNHVSNFDPWAIGVPLNRRTVPERVRLPVTR